MHITNMFDIMGRVVRHRDTGGGSVNGIGTNTLPPPPRAMEKYLTLAGERLDIKVSSWIHLIPNQLGILSRKA